VLLALEYDPPGGFDCVNVMAETPFGREDAHALASRPAEVIENRWPGTSNLVAARGLTIESLVWGSAIWPVDKARRALGYQPRHNFDGFLDALRAGDAAYYPFAGLSQWGLDAASQEDMSGRAGHVV
jgi:hypothetical protein